MDILKGIRPLDYVLAAVMVALAVALAVANVVAGDDATGLVHRLDSHSALMVPVFALAALPVLWRREHVLVAIAASTAVMAASLPMFGWVTRCGFGLPLSIAFAYAVARYAGGRGQQALGLVGVLALQAVTLLMDSSTGTLGALPLSVPAAALAYGIGVLVQSRARRRPVAPSLTPEHVGA